MEPGYPGRRHGVPAGKQVLSGSQDRSLRLRDAGSREELLPPPAK
jgi:hypothetical protein